jgi:hypothetical protein
MTPAVVAPAECEPPRIASIPDAPANVVAAAFYGVLGACKPYATSSGVEAFVGCHA